MASSTSLAPMSAGTSGSSSASTCTRQPSIESFDPPRRPDTPQLTLHQHRNLRQPVLLSPSSKLDGKKVRRKASVIDLAAGQTATAFASGPSSFPSPCIHSIAPHHFLPSSSSSPPPPCTPQAHPSTGSPSLSSTVTTLQSTPTLTPQLRHRFDFEHPWLHQRVELSEPIRTKREFPHLRQAKRLPRRAGGGGGNGGGGDSGNGNGGDGLWEVYAAIFDPVDDGGVYTPHLTPDIYKAEPWQVPDLPEDRNKRTGRTVRFTELATQSSQQSEERSESERTGEEQEFTETSTFSLSKFEFPAPPGEDNWQGTRGYLTESSPPNSPTTVYLNGTSFDLVNPHASFFLGVHNFETPAEIDGLLNDYFDNLSEDRYDDMDQRKVSKAASQQSLNSQGENSQRPRILYDDPASARRNILRVGEDIPPPPKAVLVNSYSGTSRPSLVSNPFDLSLSDNGERVDPKKSTGERRSKDSSSAWRSQATLRVQGAETKNSVSLPSAEVGLGVSAFFGDDTSPYRDSDEESTNLTPPPLSYRNGPRFRSGSSDIRTTDRTYGETNQLLRITPETESSPLPAYRQAESDLTEIITSYGQNDTATRKRFSPFPWSRQGMALDETCAPRSSSAYSRNVMEDESVWETQATESGFEQPPPLGYRPSEESYANTSTDGNEMKPVAAPTPSIREDDEPLNSAPLGTFDEDDDARRDERKAISLLSDNILMDQSPSRLYQGDNFNSEQRALDLQELERIRQRNPGVVRGASDFVARIACEQMVNLKTEVDAKLQKVKTFRPIRKDVSTHFPEHANPSFSDRRGLLDSPALPVIGNLEYSDSQDTFLTVRDERPQPRPGSPFPWSPHETDATAHALGFHSPRSISRPAKTKDKMFSKRSSRTAISGQHELHELQLLKPARATETSRPLSRPFRPTGVLTDSELAARAPKWRDEPDLTVGSALAEYAMRPEVRLAGPLDPRLLPSHDRDSTELTDAEREQQKLISERVAIRCSIFFPCSLAFSLGGFDWLIRRKTNGRIHEMGHQEKQRAFRFHFWISLFCWSIGVIVLSLLLRKNFAGREAVQIRGRSS